jgi:hypothetical protein
VLTSILDFLGLLAIAVGFGYLMSAWLGAGPGCIVAGATLIVGSTVASLLSRPARGDR